MDELQYIIYLNSSSLLACNPILSPWWNSRTNLGQARLVQAMIRLWCDGMWRWETLVFCEGIWCVQGGSEAARGLLLRQQTGVQLGGGGRSRPEHKPLSISSHAVERLESIRFLRVCWTHLVEEGSGNWPGRGYVFWRNRHKHHSREIWFMISQKYQNSLKTTGTLCESVFGIGDSSLSSCVYFTFPRTFCNEGLRNLENTTHER